jgi:DNA-binding NarL/FixJ family response regulator
MSQALRVALIDWNQNVRSARRQILDATPSTEVVFESDGNVDQLQQLPESLVDVIVIDQQLEQSSGVDAFLDLRGKYENLADVPPTVLSATFDLPELRIMCLAAGMHELVSVEAGPEAFIRAIDSAASGEENIDTESLAQLVKLTKLPQKSDFGFTQSVNALPVRKRGLVDKLATTWSAIESGSKSKFTLDQLEPLVGPLGCLTASELVIRLFQNGFLDGR